ncbi:MAG: metal-dependent hydrolase [Bacteroidetes bacterium]|nr:metal-dependent hydrolase [Bacteroidota bacterium]MCB0842158.1 metal-dependent hydrolase [Bacteroidota bacterium]MCB0852369.1 metal-dependent hydrolase [Bacteroidota bacterium]
MKITFYGHATYGIELGGKNLLFDPFISPNEKAGDIDINSIPADYILITHGHQDHVADVEAIARRTGATLISNFEIISWFANKGIEKGHPMNHGGKWNFDFGSVKYVNAVHSSTLPDGSPGGNPGGFIIESAEGNFYYSGDTALHYDMKLLGEYHNLDFAFLCMGDNFTMGVDDALIAANFVGVDRVFGMHYDTFGYIVINHDVAKAKFQKAGKTLHLLDIGESTKL